MCAPGSPSSPPPFPSTLPPSLPLLRRRFELQAPPPNFVPPHPPPPSSHLRRRRPHLRHHQVTAHLVRTSASPKPYRSSVAVFNRRRRRSSSSPPVFPCRRVLERVSAVFASLPSSFRYPRRRPPLSQSPASHWAPSAAARGAYVAAPWRQLTPPQPYQPSQQPSQRQRVLKRISN